MSDVEGVRNLVGTGLVEFVGGLLTAVLAFTVSADLWWACGSSAVVTILYLAYLRRQTRIEEQVRRRRQQRMARSRLGVENTEDRDFDVVPSRLRRPGADVLDIDDEDPMCIETVVSVSSQASQSTSQSPV